MLPLVVIVLLVHSIERVTCNAIVYKNDDLYEGDPCPLTTDGGTIGQCQKLSDCERKHARTASKCAFEGIVPIVCCDVIQRQCEAITPNVQRIADHLVGQTMLANVGEFPFMALVQFEIPSLRCGASLVSDRFLLTAAHCIRNKERSKPISVKLGTNEATDPAADVYSISKTFVHEQYQRILKQNDIAVIEVDRDIKRSYLVQPICLFTDQDDLPESQELIAMGWGLSNDENEDEGSNVLLKGNIQPINRVSCQKRFDQSAKPIKLSENQMCALGEQNDAQKFTDTCSGDSGGPLVMKRNNKFYLVGITSTGGACGLDDYAGIYTRVSKHLNWIVSKVGWNASR